MQIYNMAETPQIYNKMYPVILSNKLTNGR